MKKFQLFSEWRNVSVLGTDYADALIREKTLKTPTQYAPKTPGWTQPVVSGGNEEMKIKTVHEVVASTNSTRGGQHYLRAVVEFDDGKIREIDAIEVPIVNG